MRVIRMALFVLISAYATGAHAACESKSPAEVAEVFAHGIGMNEQFKRSAGSGDESGSRALREQTEQYHEDEVLPCVERAVQLLSEHSHPSLMRKLMELVVSYQNSGDETLPYAIGRIFAANPQSIERPIEDFSGAERAWLAEMLRFGWMNVKPDVDAAIVEDRERRIERLAVE